MKNFLFALIAIAMITLTFSCNKDQATLMGPDEALIERITSSGEVDLLIPTAVPSKVRNYVVSNFHPYQIEMVYRAHGHGYEVMLENGMCVFFDNDGSHIDHDGLHDDWSNMHGDDYNCMMGDHMDIEMCPLGIQNYIHDHHPNQEIRDLVIKPSGKLSVALDNETVLMFNPSGALVTECLINSGGNGMGMGDDGHHMHDHGYGINASGLCGDATNQGGDHPWGSGNMMGHGGQNGSQNDGACWGGESIDLDDIPPVIASYLHQNYPESELLFVMQSYHGQYMLRLEDCVRLVFDENGNLLFDSGN
jgi:hypothetical protein